MRGEHPLSIDVYSDTMGSSPHARGTLVDDVVAAEVHGIIPACAGNTLSTAGGGAFSWDHPRMRGEHHQYNVSPG